MYLLNVCIYGYYLSKTCPYRPNEVIEGLKNEQNYAKLKQSKPFLLVTFVQVPMVSRSLED